MTNSNDWRWVKVENLARGNRIHAPRSGDRGIVDHVHLFDDGPSVVRVFFQGDMASRDYTKGYEVLVNVSTIVGGAIDIVSITGDDVREALVMIREQLSPEGRAEGLKITDETFAADLHLMTNLWTIIAQPLVCQKIGATISVLKNSES